MKPLRVLVWGENVHERQLAAVAALYPDGMHNTLARTLRERLDGAEIETATLQEPEHGLSGPRLEQTDVLLWWGHAAHDAVDDRVVERVRTRVLEGMGLIVLHSGHYAKIFKALMGTTCSLSWREGNDRERLWTVLPAHPIAEGVGECIELPGEEMYSEPFGIPTPDELVFISWFSGGEVFRSGATWRRGHGRVFYFRPGHETYPTYHHPQIQQVIANAVRWARPTVRIPDACRRAEPRERVTEGEGGTPQRGAPSEP